MRKSLGLTVVLAILGVCAPSYGYILVYNVTGGMKAVDDESSKIVSVSVKGYLAMDINDSGEVNDAKMVLYGKDTSGAPVYYVDDLNSTDASDNAYWFTSGSVVGIDVHNYDGNFFYEFTMIGTVKATDVGLGASSKQWVASSLSGSLASWLGQLLDDDQALFGSGAATMTLDTKETKAANAGSLSVDTVINAFIAGLEAKGYHPIVLD